MVTSELRQYTQMQLAQQRLAAFILYTFKGYKMGWVHREICQKLDRFLDDVAAGRSPRLMLMMPPRHGKSEIVSRRFPAYVLGRYPDFSIIATSYSSDLASRNNLDVQRIIDGDEYRAIFDKTVLTAKGTGGNYRRTSELFEIVNRKGSYRSAGVCGGITGMGCNILIIDDPIKDRGEADSESTRERIYKWYTSTAYTRLEAGGGVLVIMTRWHTDDLCGRLLDAMKTGGEQWEVIDYPAIATRDEKHRKEGEALHPERYPLLHLLKTKTSIGGRDWESLYQQHPVADGGNIFKDEWVQHYQTLPDRFDQMIQSWDMAFKDATNSDYVVGQVWGRKGADLYLIDQIRGRMSFTQTLDAVVKLTNKHPKALTKLIEDKANGTAVIDVLKHTVQGIVPVTPTESKTSRAYAVTALFEAGNVYLPDPKNVPWAIDYELELLQFPAAAHDDQVDATTQALRGLSTRRKMQFNSANLQQNLPRMW